MHCRAVRKLRVHDVKGLREAVADPSIGVVELSMEGGCYGDFNLGTHALIIQRPVQVMRASKM